MPERSLSLGGAGVTVDLRSHFGLPDVTGTVVQFDSVFGRYNFELFDDTPLTKANFLEYVNGGRYNNTIVHRAPPDFVVQAGGYLSKLPLEHIATFAAVRNEFRRSNLRGTVAMAKIGGNPDSATSEWFVNLGNNAGNLDNQNGGFTVFARVIGNGMSVIETISRVPRFTVDGMGDFPLRDVAAGQANVQVSNFVTINSASVVPIYPAGGARSVIAFTAQSSNPGVATLAVVDSTLLLTPVSVGSTTITVRATDTNSVNAETSFTVTVTGGIAIVAPPQSQFVQLGSTATLSVTAQSLQGALTYQWLKDGTPIAGATAASYTIPSVPASASGFYAVRVTDGINTETSSYAILTVNVPGGSRIINVSTRGGASSGEALTPGFVMRGNGTKNLLVRAVGPTLGIFGVTGTLSDPKMDLIPSGQTSILIANDDWGTPASQVAALTTTATNVGAFALPAGSKDSAALAALPVTGISAYTVSITPAGGVAGGVALAEIYDADALTSPTRLINVSTRGTVTADGLTPGFVITGTSPKQLLIRAVGPGLTAFGVGGVLADPTLTIIPLSRDFSISSNNDWSDSGRAAIEAAAVSAGAFPLTAGSKDAAVLVRLPPGGYTAVVTGVGGTTGVALVEVYDLDP